MESGKERRRGERHLACFPIHERSGDGKPRTAMIRELSIVGAQILTQTRRDVGQNVSLSLYLVDDAPPRDVDARVVRCEKREDGGVWPWVSFVEFATPLPDLEPQVKALAQKQEETYGPRSDRK